MEDDALLLISFLGMGLLIGVLLMWMILRLRIANHYVSREEVERDYIASSRYQDLSTRQEQEQQLLVQERSFRQNLDRELSAAHEQIRQLENRLADSEQHLRTQFENLANKLLEEKSQKFTAQNAEHLQQLLGPLREQINLFRTDSERRHRDETKDRITLREEIKHLRSLNEQLSQDANNLVGALKGDQKVQGDWGEWQLERLLEISGLQRNVHYRAQPSFINSSGKTRRPDFIVQLPENKHLIIDSKVSLVAYDRWCQESDEKLRKQQMQQHVYSLRNHIKGLSDKKYEQLDQLQSPDYLLLFVPIEPALTLALQADPNIFTEALERNIVLVSNTTLLVALRTVAFSWRQEQQKQNVQAIAKQSGLLYDKFCGFVDDIQQIGKRLRQADEAYQGALNKLSESSKYGDTLVGRAERIRELGAQSSKRLPEELVRKDYQEKLNLEMTEE